MNSVISHMIDHKTPYVIVVMLLLMGGTGVGVGESWVDERINLRIAGLEEQVKEINVLLLEQQMRDLQILICRSPGESVLLAQMSRLQSSYRKVAKMRYQLPSCIALGIVAMVSPHETPEALATR